MKLDRLPYEPGAVLDFYEEGLTALGALCERTWYDRIEVVADGRTATLWHAEDTWHSGELQFVPADATAARDADREVFPGCPLTFRLAEALRPTPLPLERVVLTDEAHNGPPNLAVAEKRWRSQFPDTTRWRLVEPFKTDFHFSLLGLVRCEIQAIDQHWSLHRVAVSLPRGEPDDELATGFAWTEANAAAVPDFVWPTPEPAQWRGWIERALEQDLATELVSIRTRQENSLRRELERVDHYFDDYARELNERTRRRTSETARVKTADRLAAAQAEHARRRADQVARHEIRVQPYLDALLFVAEPAWRASVQIERAHRSEVLEARYLPRARRWEG